jgi:hypothetical protein
MRFFMESLSDAPKSITNSNAITPLFGAEALAFALIDLTGFHYESRLHRHYRSHTQERRERDALFARL